MPVWIQVVFLLKPATFRKKGLRMHLIKSLQLGQVDEIGSGNVCLKFRLICELGRWASIYYHTFNEPGHCN